MLKKLSSAAKAAPADATRALSAALSSARVPVTPTSLPPKISWIIGDAIPMTPIPALTLRQSTDQSSQNCGVFQAFATWTLPRVIMPSALGGGGVQPGGVHPGGGRR